MAGLNQIQAERAARPAFNGPSNNLFLKNGDIAFFHFIGTGNDDDPYIEVFLAHELPPSGEQTFGQPTYCPVISGHDSTFDCPNCGKGYKTKERMRMWLFVTVVLVKTARDGEQLPQVNFGGQVYFRRDLNRPLIWDNSAWRESPLDEMIFQHGTLGNLRNSQFTLRATGDNRDRRYKLATVSGSAPFDESVLTDEHRAILRPLREMMLEEIKPVETVARPDGNGASDFSPVQSPVAPADFSPVTSVPQTDPSLLASAPPPGFETGQAPKPPEVFQPVVGTKATY